MENARVDLPLSSCIAAHDCLLHAEHSTRGSLSTKRNSACSQNASVLRYAINASYVTPAAQSMQCLSESVSAIALDHVEHTRGKQLPQIEPSPQRRLLVPHLRR